MTCGTVHATINEIVFFKGDAAEKIMRGNEKQVIFYLALSGSLCTEHRNDR